MGSESSLKINGKEPSRSERLGSALFYGLTSLAVIFLNKIILSQYHFPHFIVLAGFQFLSTSVILYALQIFKKIELPPVSWGIIKEVSPIASMFLLNVISGLGSTKALNLPMFTVLRRFSILMTMIGEYLILAKQPSTHVTVSVAMMVGGAIVAALNDLTFDINGYILVLSNDLFTALNGIYLKRATLSGRYSKLAVLFYNSLLSGVVVGLYYFGEHVYLSSVKSPPQLSTLSRVWAFEHWTSTSFCVLFMSATVMGTVLNYSTFLCTSINSPLTTTVVGCLKNVLTTYVGMVFMSDYQYSVLNSLGVNISIIGSLWYTYVNIFRTQGSSSGGGNQEGQSVTASLLPVRKGSDDNLADNIKNSSPVSPT